MNNDELDLIERQHPLYESIMLEVMPSYVRLREDCLKEQDSECIDIDNIKYWLLSLLVETYVAN